MKVECELHTDWAQFQTQSNTINIQRDTQKEKQKWLKSNLILTVNQHFSTDMLMTGSNKIHSKMYVIVNSEL